MVELQLGGVLDVVRIGVLVAWGEEIVEAGEHPLQGNRVGRVCQHSALAILSSTAWSTKAQSGITLTLVRFLSCTVPKKKKPAGGSGLRAVAGTVPEERSPCGAHCMALRGRVQALGCGRGVG